MADTKITALAAITTVDPAADVLPIVDVSDHSMAASGTTKNITTNQILGAGGTATLASATITGDLTVDTSTLKVDSANNRVGIGTASPTVPLYVTGNNATATAIMQDETNGAKLRLLANSINFDISNGGGGGDIAVSGANPFTFRTNGSERYRIASDGIATWSNVGGVAGTAMTLNSTGLGVGVAPTQPLTVRGSVAAIGMFHSTNANGPYIIFQNSTANFGDIGSELAITGGGSAGNFTLNSRFTSNLCFAVSDSVKMRLDSSGNLLVGLTADSFQPTKGIAANASNSSRISVGHANGTASGDYYHSFAYDGAVIGSITQSGTTGVAFNATSDYRLKEAVAPLTGGLARVSALKPSIYKWKADGSNGEGFLAHELAEVVPAAVSGEKDAVNEDGSIKPQGVDMSRVVPILVAAIQELTAEVNALKNA